MHHADVTCPSCFQDFSVPAPYVDELPADVDYDCEICCRPMTISFSLEDDEIIAEAFGLGA